MTWQTQSFQNSRICPLPARPAILVSSSLNGTVHPLGCSNQKPGNRVSIVLLYPPFSHSVGQWVLSILAPNLLISFCLLWHHPSLSNHHILLMWTMTVISYWYSGPQSHCPSSLLGTLFPPSTGALHKLFSQFVTPSAWVILAQSSLLSSRSFAKRKPCWSPRLDQGPTLSFISHLAHSQCSYILIIIVFLLLHKCSIFWM